MSEQKKEIEKEDSWDQPYKCNLCDDRVNYTFILPFIRKSGLCPDCYCKNEEEQDGK